MLWVRLMRVPGWGNHVPQGSHPDEGDGVRRGGLLAPWDAHLVRQAGGDPGSDDAQHDALSCECG